MARRLTFLIIAAVAGFATIASAADLRMSQEQLRALLGKPELIVLDVRIAKDWNAGNLKIPGAVRERSELFGAWADKYPKDKTLVLYCA